MTAARPVRWGILGTGAIADTTAAAIGRVEGSELVAVASRDAERAAAWAAARGIPRWFGDYAALLDADGIDAVYVALPNALHAEWTLRAIDRRLAVLCEKPLCATASDAERVAGAAEAAGVLVVEAFMYRLQPVHDALIGAIRSGAIGRVRSVRAGFSFALDEPGSIVDSRALGGGALLDVGCYCVDAVLGVMDAIGGGAIAQGVAGGGDGSGATRMGAGHSGAEWTGGGGPGAALPIAVAASVRADEVDRGVVATLRFAGGEIATVEAAIDAAEHHVLEVHGTTGRLVVDEPWVPAASATLRVERHREAAEVIAVPAIDAYAEQVRRFGAALRREQPPFRSLETSVRTARVVDAIVAATGRTAWSGSPS